METVTLEQIHGGLESLKKDISFIKRVVAEDFELSEEAKRELKEARGTSEEEYVDQEQMEKEFL